MQICAEKSANMRSNYQNNRLEKIWKNISQQFQNLQKTG